MTYRPTAHGYLIRLSRGENVLETLTTFCEQQRIAFGVFTAIGAVERAQLGYYDLPTKTYKTETFPEVREVVSMTGNVALVDGKPFLHTHTLLSDSDMHPVGGHVIEAVVAVTLEVYLTVFEGELSRKHDDEVGLKLLDL